MKALTAEWVELPIFNEVTVNRFLLAAGQGDAVAKTGMTWSGGLMSQEQVAEGQKLAGGFEPRKVPASGGDSSAAGIGQTRPESSGTGFFITEDGYYQ